MDPQDHSGQGGVKKNLHPSTTPGSSFNFTSGSDRSKRRKPEKLNAEQNAEQNAEELPYAAEMSHRSSGELNAAEVTKNITFTTPTRASKYYHAYETV